MLKGKSLFLKNYGFSILLIFSISLGSLLGVLFKERSVVFKPFGDIFLNLLFTIVVPMVFFSISSTVASMTDLKRLGRIMFWMIIIFLVTGAISSLLMILGVKIFPLALNLQAHLDQPTQSQQITVMQ